MHHSRRQEKILQDKIVELNTKLVECAQLPKPTQVKRHHVNKNKTLPTIYIVTPTYKRFVQKSELTRLKQAFQGVENLHWIVVEDSPRKTKLVRNFLDDSALKFTHLNIRTPSLLRKHKGEARRFKPRGVYQRNIGINWIRENVDSEKTQGVVYFADDDNTYDRRIFDEVSCI